MILYPEYLILDLEDEFKDFYCMLNDVAIITKNITEIISQIINIITIAEDDIYNAMLYNIVQDMSLGEGLYDHARVEEHERDIVMYVVFELGKKIKKTIINLNAYTDGFFPYQFHQLLNKNTVVFKRNNEDL